MIDSSDLSSDVLALGELVGLLVAADGGATVNTGWFSNPLGSLETIDTRLGSLVSVIDGVLGPPLDDAPDVFSGARWYPVPNPSTGGGTPFCVVTPPVSATSGQLGIGVLCPVALGTLTIQAFAYVPLFSYGPSGASFIADSLSDPSQVGLYVTTTEPFSVDGVSFTALMVEAEIYLAAQAPGLKLTFENLTGTTAPSTYTTLQSLLDPTVDSWIGEVIVQGGYWLNLYIGGSATTVGEVLVAANFLTVDSSGQYHLSLAQLQGQTPLDIALNFVFAGLDALANLDVPLLALPGGGVYIAYDEASGDYGLRFVADLSLEPTQSGTGAAPPTIDLSLGSWFSGETDATNWLGSATGSPSPPAGLSIFMLNRNPASQALTFAPGFELVSAGISVAGGAGTPLVNLDGYTLQGVDLRTYLSSAGWNFGFGARLDTVGFPLGPAFQDAQNGSAGSNAVAQNLLASGGGGGSGSADAVNPGFSAELAYVYGHTPYFEILDASGAQTDIIWFPIQRRFGPLNCQQIGLRLDLTGPNANNPVVGIVFDGGVMLSVLDVELDQLSINAHLKEIASVSGYSLDLQGLALSFNSGAVEISGGLMKNVGQGGIVSYDGEALIKFADWSIAALGSYCSLPGGGTSLFIFGVLDAPLGGPGFFFVTGLAAGFGFNRGLTLPAQGDVSSFPLVAMMVDASAIGGNTSPATVLATLESGNWVPLERGEYWLAAGLQFTSFEIINTNALVVIEFGKEFVISLLGTSVLRQPLVGTAYVYAELDIEVIFAPQEGVFKASAVLSKNSYVLTEQAHLTGGFAAYAWFGDNPHAGDFVFTLGGYHPAFKVPSYYPQEPRVGINWQISSQLALVGNAYLAITPVAMMAGVYVALTFDDGNLKAWLKVQADAILFWKPFYLIADASISVGVSYRIDVLFVHKTLSVEIGADFQLWGPPVGGTVHVNWFIISFTIGFGAKEQFPSSMSWDDFKGMLPSKTQQTASSAPRATLGAGPVRSRRALATAAPPQTTTTAAYLTVNATQGILRTGTVGSLSVWLVRPEQLVLTLTSAIPSTQIVVVSENPADDLTIAGQPVGMRGVSGVSPSNYQATQTVTILALPESGVDIQTIIDGCLATTSPCTGRPAGCAGIPVDIQGWTASAVTGQVPAAMWGPPVPAGQAPNINDPNATIAATTGVTVAPAQRPITNCTPQMVIAQVFGDLVVNQSNEQRLPLSQDQQPSGTPPAPADSFADIANVNSAGVSANRQALFVALQALGVSGWTNDPLPLMAASPGLDFADEPLEGAPAAAPVPVSVS